MLYKEGLPLSGIIPLFSNTPSPLKSAISYLQMKQVVSTKAAKLLMISDSRYEDSKVNPKVQHFKRSLQHDHQVIARKPHPGKE